MQQQNSTREERRRCLYTYKNMNGKGHNCMSTLKGLCHKTKIATKSAELRL